MDHSFSAERNVFVAVVLIDVSFPVRALVFLSVHVEGVIHEFVAILPCNQCLALLTISQDPIISPDAPCVPEEEPAENRHAD